MRVVLAHDVADDARALGEAAVRAVAAVVHRVEHAAVHRLEPVAHVGQRAADDDASSRSRGRSAASRPAGRPARSGCGPVGGARRSVDVVSHGRVSCRYGVGRGAPDGSDVEEADVLGVALDEGAAALDVLAHQHGRTSRRPAAASSRVTCSRIRVVGVHRGLPQLLGVHLAETLVALDRRPPWAACLPGGEPGRDQRVALAVGVGVLVRVA